MEEASPPPGVYTCRGPLHHSWVSADDADKCCNGYTRETRVLRDQDGNHKLEFYWEPVVEPEGPAEPDAPSATGPADVTPPPKPADGPASGMPSSTALAHSAFFRRVAEITDDSAPAWRAFTAGLLTLRLVDRWATRQVTGREPTFKEFALVRRAIEDVDDDRMHEVLISLTDSLRTFSDADVASIPKLLFAYGLLLEDIREWPLAVDVYETALDRADVPECGDGIPLVYVRLGWCLIQLALTTEAEAIYIRGLDVANALGDVAGALRIRTAQAGLAIHLEDYARATTLLDAVIADAQSTPHVEMFARANHDRGCVAIHNGQFEDAARYLFDAFERYSDPAWRERALSDLGIALASLGVRSGARDAFHLLYASAQLAPAKAMAGINLLQLAGDEGDEASFEEWRRTMEATTLPTRTKAEFYLRLAEGYRQLRHEAPTSLAYRVLEILSHAHGLTDYLPKAEAGLRGEVTAIPVPARPVPDAIAALLDRLRDYRRQYGDKLSAPTG